MIRIEISTDKQGQESIILPIRVTPKSSKDGFIPYVEGSEYIQVKLRALPEDGQANTALIQLLSKTFGIPKRDITLVSGHQSRLKRLRLLGDAAYIRTLLAEYLEIRQSESWFNLI